MHSLYSILLLNNLLSMFKIQVSDEYVPVKDEIGPNMSEINW